MPSPAASVATRKCAPPSLGGLAEELDLLSRARGSPCRRGSVAIWPVKPMPSRRRTRKSSVSRCSVKMISFSPAKRGSAQDLAQLLELRLLAAVVAPACARSQQPLDLLPLRFAGRPARRRRRRRGARPRRPRSPRGRPRRVSSSAVVASNGSSRVLGEPLLAAAAAAPCVMLAGLDVGDQVVELLEAPLERAQQGVGGAGQAALEDAHGQAGGRAVQDAGPVVVRARCSRWSRRRASAR